MQFLYKYTCIYMKSLLSTFWSLSISNWMVIHSFWIWRRRGKWDSHVNGIVFRVRFPVNWVSVTSPNNVGEGGERKKKGVYLSRIWLIQSGQSTQSLQMAVVCSPWFWCVHRHKMPMKFNICLTVYLTFNYWMIIIECWMKALIRRKLLHGVFKLVIFTHSFVYTR